MEKSSFLSIKSYLPSEELSLTWRSAVPVPLVGMSRCVLSAGICISATTAVVTDIVPSVRTRSVSSGLHSAGKRLSLPSTSMSYSLCPIVCIPLRWLIRGSAAKRGLTSGMTAILHSWGSNLFYHPHIHCIVPGGGVDKHGVWHHLKGCKRSDFLFPVAAMSEKFYGRFMHLITRRLKEKDVIINQEIRRQCKEKHWVVHSKPPAKGVGQVLEYIGRYAYRVAITNSRILDVTDSHISFDYKNYRSGGKHEVSNIRIDDFLTRLSQHILPDRFVRIRHYGFLSPCNRGILRCIQLQLNVPPVPKERKKRSYIEICYEKGWDIGICKDCNCQRIIMRIIKPAPRAPPSIVWHIGH